MCAACAAAYVICSVHVVHFHRSSLFCFAYAVSMVLMGHDVPSVHMR